LDIASRYKDLMRLTQTLIGEMSRSTLSTLDKKKARLITWLFL
jgi:hypothetical protein